MLIDMPLEELRAYLPESTRAADFDAYWQRTLEESRRQPLNLSLTPVEYPVEEVTVREVRYDGWRGARIAGFYLTPAQARNCPALVYYHGYGANRGAVHDYLMWVLQGYAVLAIDMRGQNGQSTDPGRYSSGAVRGWMTKGILNPEEYYYRGVYVDCVRALDVIAAQPEVDPTRIGITGVSQGGGLTLAVAALDDRPKLAMPDIPFLCHFRRAIQLTDLDPYQEIALFCRWQPQVTETVFTTLSYIDTLNLADRIRCPVIMTVALRDETCPPSTVFGVYNRITAPKEMAIYDFAGHERPMAHQPEKFRAARRYLRG